MQEKKISLTSSSIAKTQLCWNEEELDEAILQSPEIKGYLKTTIRYLNNQTSVTLLIINAYSLQIIY